jgi:hypothetical protein
VRSFTVERSVFIARLRQMAEYPHRLSPLVGGHGSFKPSQIALCSFGRQSQPDYAIVDRRACWTDQFKQTRETALNG